MAARQHTVGITTMVTHMDIMPEHSLKLIRLMHLVSPSLPTGAFAYSQGLEWAVECGWVSDEESLQQWIHDLMSSSMVTLDLPVLKRIYSACEDNDQTMLFYWSDLLLASRETSELRLEERNRGRAMVALLPELGLPVDDGLLPSLKDSQLGSFAFAAVNWHIPLEEALTGYLWSWLENMTLAGVKIIPLGQSAGQRVLSRLTRSIPECINSSQQLSDEEVGSSTPAQAIASSLHETQYTRIYRS